MKTEKDIIDMFWGLLENGKDRAALAMFKKYVEMCDPLDTDEVLQHKYDEVHRFMRERDYASAQRVADELDEMLPRPSACFDELMESLEYALDCEALGD